MVFSNRSVKTQTSPNPFRTKDELKKKKKKDSELEENYIFSLF